MRLIDADELKNCVSDTYGRGGIYNTLIWYEDALSLINEAPTIDAVPVVRCKECKKWKADGTYEFGIDGVKRMWGSCSNSLHHCKDNHFCSYGEKED